MCEQCTDTIHLVLTDVIMPEMSGKALADRLTETLPGARILFMSGYTDDAIAHHGVLDTGIHFLAKPFTAAELACKVRKVLDGGSTTTAAGKNLRAIEPDVETREPALGHAARLALPENVLKRLYEAIIAARYDELVEIIETIRSSEPELAATLRRMVDHFDYDGLLEFLR